jgi:hypothetical protein
MNEEKTLAQLHAQGVRVYGKTIVSPFSTKDSAAKMQLINFMVERCGYTLADGKGFPTKPLAPVEEAAHV